MCSAPFTILTCIDRQQGYVTIFDCWLTVRVSAISNYANVVHCSACA